MLPGENQPECLQTTLSGLLADTWRVAVSMLEEEVAPWP